MSEKDRVLVICAHPDDETLGMGGTMALYAKEGVEVYVLIFANGEYGREDMANRIIQRREQGKKACSVLGVKDVKFLNYDDQKLDIIPLAELSHQIELAIKEWDPKIIYTHFWGDVNQDHKKVFEATLIATRPTPYSKIKKIVCFETPSSTEWGSVVSKFTPNLFVNIDGFVEKKLEAFKHYEKEVHPYPHPRSEEALTSRARYWGSSVGIKYAEVFVNIREIV